MAPVGRCRRLRPLDYHKEKGVIEMDRSGNMPLIVIAFWIGCVVGGLAMYHGYGFEFIDSINEFINPSPPAPC